MTLERTTDGFAPYMRWSKTRAPSRHDRAGSNLLACTVDDLPGAREALEIAGLNPDGYPPLLDAIAAHYGASADRIVPASGAGGANFLAIAALVRPGDEVLVERPGYDPLLGAPRLMGANVVRFERRFDDGFAIDPDAVRAAITPKTRLVIMTNPHNPSGVLASTDALAEVGEIARSVGARVLVDEVYLDATYGERVASASHISDVFVTTSSLTKSYGLSGLRAGWIVAAPAVASVMLQARDVMEGVGPMPSDVLAVLAFAQLDRLRERARSIVLPNVALLRAFMASHPQVEWVEPRGGTVAFPRLVDVDDASDFVTRLARDYDTAVVPGRFFEAPSHFRIATGGAPAAFAAGLAAVGDALESEPRGQ
jgi:aspartate/methionine/tyrosine aminotransferase